MLFAASCLTCLHFYCAMAIGYSFANKKSLLSVVAFFCINFIISFIQSMLMSTLINFDVNLSINISDAAEIHLMLLGLMLYSAFWSFVLYLPTRLLLKKKLNLP